MRKIVIPMGWSALATAVLWMVWAEDRPSATPLPEHIVPLLTKLSDGTRPDALSAAERRVLRQALAAPTPTRASADSDLMSASPGITATYNAAGVTLRDEAGNTSWSLNYTGIRCGAGLTAGTQQAPRGEDGRVVYDRGAGVDEWYVSGRDGLEQGFTIDEPPCADSAWAIALTLGGTGTARHASAEGAIYLTPDHGIGGLRYGDLYAYDSAGERLAARIEQPQPDVVHLRIDAARARYPIYIDPWVAAQVAYMKAANSSGEDYFGLAVAGAGNTIVVGANGEDSNATGVTNGAGFSEQGTASYSGAAYVFVRTNDTWTQQAYLKAANTGTDAYFGNSVAVAGDTIVVGAPGEDSNATGVTNGAGFSTPGTALFSGAAYVFVRTNDTWTQQAYLKAANTGAHDFFGVSVGVAGDTIVVGASREDSNATGVTNGAGFSEPGESNQSGAAYVFVRTNDTWSQQAYFKAANTGAGDFFGDSLAVAGDTIVVGAKNEDSNATGATNGAGFSEPSTVSDSGAAYVFVRTNGTWSQQAYLKAANTGAGAFFGNSLAVAGDTIVVGAFAEDSNATGVTNGPGFSKPGTALRAGASYVFVRANGTWSQQAYLKAANTGGYHQFGRSVAVAGDTIVVGADEEDSNATGVTNGSGFSRPGGAPYAGAAYVFVRTNDTWTQQAYLKAAHIGENDYFGGSVAVAGDTIVVGAYGEDGNATGVTNGLGFSGSGGTAFTGAAYVFRVGQFEQLVFVDGNVTGYCPTSGKRIRIGLDDGSGDGAPNDGILHNDEVDENHHVCDGTAGASGATGAAGTQGTPGSDGAAGATGAAGTQGTPGSDGAAGATGATGPQGSSDAEQAQVASCTAVDNGDGTKAITCADGTSIVVRDGAKGGCGATPVPLLATLVLTLALSPLLRRQPRKCRRATDECRGAARTRSVVLRARA